MLKPLMFSLFALISFPTYPFNFTLGSGDVVNIEIFPQQEHSRQNLAINWAGTVSLPLIGEVDLSGKTVGESQSMIKERYEKNYLKNASVTVTIVKYMSQSFVVMGEVFKKGRMILSKETSVLEAISLAGGVSENASKSLFILRMKEGEGKTVDSIIIDLDAITRGDFKHNIEVHHDDFIFVPRNMGVSVLGEVKNQGVIAYDSTLNIAQAISRAGGVTQQGNLGAITVIRKVDGKNRTFLLDITDRVTDKFADFDFELKPNDVVIISGKVK